jgi:glucose/arabinose dehydrogenase
MPRRRTKVALAVGGLVLVGVGAGIGVAVASADDDRPTPSRRAADRECERPYVELLPSPPAPKDEGRTVELVARVPQPTALVFAPGGGDDGLVASRSGEVRVVTDGEIGSTVVLDLTDRTIDSGDGGLLAIAYDPVEPWLYAYRTTREQDEELLAFPLDDDGIPVLDGQRLLLAVDHPPSEQHHGGGMAFGPDGHLYLGLGDGGGLGDPRENGQDPSTLLGKVLRISPTPEAEEPYAVPSDNPFVGRDGHRPEIWALGLRNPFRLGFDQRTGDLWIGDVGQACWEELNRLPAGVGGQNLGWDVREGATEFEGGEATGGETLEPEHAYAHRRGWCAIVVGFVDPDGGLLHTDYCKGRLTRLVPAAGGEPPRLEDLGVRVQRPIGLVEGPDGAAWILTLEGEVYRVEL